MKRTASEPGLSPSNKMQFTDRKKFITDRILLLRSVRPFTGLYAIFKSLPLQCGCIGQPSICVERVWKREESEKLVKDKQLVWFVPTGINVDTAGPPG